MTRVEVNPGICGLKTTIEAAMDGETCHIRVESACPSIQKLAEALTEVSPFDEISFHQSVPETIKAGMQYCPHAACPVPVGILKAVEVEAGLALPADVSIKVSRGSQ